MYTLASDEKITSVMAYTNDGLIRGDAVTKQGIRVSTWLRTETAPDYLHIYGAQWIGFTGGALKPMTFSEMHLPISTILGFHILPPAQEPVDYNEQEDNRVPLAISVLMGKFLVKGNLRVSPRTDFATSLTNTHTKWLSIYEADIHSPYVPQMPALQVSMIIVRTMEVAFAS